MARYAYIRVSTQAQSYDRQILEFREYFKRHSIAPDGVEYVSEKISSHTSYKEREIFKLIDHSRPGDVIYACQLDRFGRTVQDVLDLVDFAMSKGVELITTDGHTIENKTPMGKMMLTMLAAFAEMERTLRAERCQSGTDSAIEEIKKHGKRISRSSGKEQTRWGNAKGCDMSKAQDASALSRADAKIRWRETSVAYKWAMARVTEGMPRKEVVRLFNELHTLNPETYCTRSGKRLTEAILCQWIKEANPFVVA